MQPELINTGTQSGAPIIYMATYITAEPSAGELRFIGMHLTEKCLNVSN